MNDFFCKNVFFLKLADTINQIEKQHAIIAAAMVKKLLKKFDNVTRTNWDVSTKKIYFKKYCILCKNKSLTLTHAFYFKIEIYFLVLLKCILQYCQYYN